METMAGEALSSVREKLHALMRRFEPKKTLEPLRVSWSERGVPRGAITEVAAPAGRGKTSRIVSILKENPKLRVAWIEEDFSLYPIALAQSGVNLSQVLFVEAKSKASWSALQCMRSHLFEIIVIHAPKKFGDVELRRLQLAAEKNEVALLLLSDEERSHKSWAVKESVNLEEALPCERSAS